jgi:hypothetical protein
MAGRFVLETPQVPIDPALVRVRRRAAEMTDAAGNSHQFGSVADLHFPCGNKKSTQRSQD